MCSGLEVFLKFPLLRKKHVTFLGSCAGPVVLKARWFECSIKARWFKPFPSNENTL